MAGPWSLGLMEVQGYEPSGLLYSEALSYIHISYHINAHMYMCTHIYAHSYRTISMCSCAAQTASKHEGAPELLLLPRDGLKDPDNSISGPK